MPKDLQVAVLMACHNRRELTLQCLESLIAAKPDNWTLSIYLVDDGSTDGTSAAVGQLPLDIKIIQGPGDWFWAHSMFQAEQSIDKPYDAILWINDDVQLFQDALMRVENVRQVNRDSILVGQFMDPITKELTYGGVKKIGRHPFHFELVFAGKTNALVDTFNGNFVFLPKEISEKVGKIDGGFSHAYADYDFGMRTQRLGFKSLVIAGFLGVCADNHPAIKENLRERFAALHSPKGLPLESQIRYLRRHGRIEWPIYLIFPYIRTALGLASMEQRRSTSTTDQEPDKYFFKRKGH